MSSPSSFYSLGILSFSDWKCSIMSCAVVICTSYNTYINGKSDLRLIWSPNCTDAFLQNSRPRILCAHFLRLFWILSASWVSLMKAWRLCPIPSLAIIVAQRTIFAAIASCYWKCWSNYRRYMAAPFLTPSAPTSNPNSTNNCLSFAVDSYSAPKSERSPRWILRLDRHHRSRKGSCHPSSWSNSI